MTMSVTITINGQLTLDQTNGQQDDDVLVGVSNNPGDGNDVLTGDLDSDFLNFLNNSVSASLLSDQQMAFAARVEGASEPNLVSVSATANETIGKLFFSDAQGNDFDGDQVFRSAGVPLTTAGGANIYLWSASNGKVVLATTSNVDAASGSLVAAFYIESNNAQNSSAKVESITFTALAHPDAANPDDTVDFSDILRVSAVITTPIGDDVEVDDDGPTITSVFDADPATLGLQSPEKLGNAAGQTAGGVFGYDLGADDHDAAFYTGGGSDFVDVNGTLVGLQINLAGTIDNPQNPAITNAVVTKTAESLTSASFGFTFHYDKDPITPGVQDATAGGVLSFDKANDTYTFTLNDPIDGFAFSVLHTNELLQKVPTGNTGHPPIVVTELDADSPGAPADGFYVQFTANSVTSTIGFGFNGSGDGAPLAGDTSFNNGQFVTNNNEDWVSATQSTNGVAGDTIQKGELLTLRFFGENILSDAADNDPATSGVQTIEKVDPTTTAAGIAIKFDGIGASEDLIVILDLIDGSGNETTRAVNVQNTDLIKGVVPAPYSAEFSLDNNDALLVIESNDYNAAGETYQIQGVQIMQSANGLTGNAINLNGAVDNPATLAVEGGSSATSALTAWDPTDNDVLKIVDIGFIQQTSGTLDASLDFSFQLVDADLDTSTVEHLYVSVSNDWIV